MTKQELLTKIWDKFIVKNQHIAKDFGLPNSYRLAQWLDCPIGVLLPDALYHEGMEGLSFLLVCRQFPEVQDYFGSDNTWFLLKIQEAHDTSSNVEEFEQELREIANFYNLEIPVTENVL